MAYGCFNRGPFQENYTTTWGEVLPFPMARDCQYQKDDKYADPGCAGCKHKLLGQVLDGRVLSLTAARSAKLKAINIVQIPKEPT